MDNNVEARQTVIRLEEQFKDRWTSYGAETGLLELSERLSPENLKQYKIFQKYPDKFLEEISPDITVAKWCKDAILFEEGNYIDLAFCILNGQVEAFVNNTEEADQPIFDGHRTKIFDQVSDSFIAPKHDSTQNSILHVQIKKQPQAESIMFLSAMDFNLQTGTSMTLTEGEFLGEIGALSGWPQSVTARTKTECDLIQIKVSALRKMKSKSKDLKAYLDKIYKEKYLVSHLRQTPLFRNLPGGFIESLASEVDLISVDPNEPITTEGEPADALFLVRSGFLKLAQNIADGQMVVTYLSKGMTLGEVELLVENMDTWFFTASSVAHTELLKISYDKVREIFETYPITEKLLWESAVSRIKESGYGRKNISHSQFIETALEKGLIQGNSILVIDLDTCTRCDDCVRACAATHGGQPRFVREGDKYENLLITKACFHCRDPVCLIGCPTGAIHRTNVGDVVAISDNICIGCKVCAINCPYDAIQMHETGETWPEDMMPERLRGKNRLLASKCDLCYTSKTGPACVRNCPNGCAIRVGTLEEFHELLADHN